MVREKSKGGRLERDSAKQLLQFQDLAFSVEALGPASTEVSGLRRPQGDCRV